MKTLSLRTFWIVCTALLLLSCTDGSKSSASNNTSEEEGSEAIEEDATSLPAIDTFGAMGGKDAEADSDQEDSVITDIEEDAAEEGGEAEDTAEEDDTENPDEDILEPDAADSGTGDENDSAEGDTGGGDAEGPYDGATGDITEPEETYPWEDCDAGDVAWARRAIQALLGRNPRGINEARALAAMVEVSDRETVARGLMELPDYTSRWADFLMDEVRVNRVGDKAPFNCYPSTPSGGDGGTLAAHIRDNPTSANYPGGQFNMSEVLGSALDLDDLSPFYRAHLFAMMSKPITGANVAALELDITRRQDFGEIFSAVYTHRGVVCVSCHNSAWGVTDSADPEKDLHWPLPGLFEEAIYGSSAGRAEMEVYSAFRHLGVVGGNARPWDMSQSCGSFTPKENISSDPAEIDGFLVSAIGKTGSIWDVEAALQNGFDKLRDDGLQLNNKTNQVDPEEGFAYLVCTRIVNQVWQEVHGYPLTLVHYIPRNKEQRDTLLELTTEFVESGFSLKTLLVSVVTHPLTNQMAPRMGCGEDSPYILPRVWNPWVLDEIDEEMRINSAGDGIHRKGARAMLRTLSTAMNWPSSPDYPNSSEEEFLKAIGVFVKDAEPGFLGVDFQGMLSWESRYGTCENQSEDFDWIVLLLDAMGIYAAENGVPPTLRQLISALKDRLIMEPEISEDEALALASFAEIESIDIPAFQVADLQLVLRRLCGVFAESPQFLLVGASEQLDNVAPPVVVVDGLTFKSSCETLSPFILPESIVSCGSDSLTID